MGVKQSYDILFHPQLTNSEVTQGTRSLESWEEQPRQNSWNNRELTPGCVDSYFTLTFIGKECPCEFPIHMSNDAL